MDGFERGHAALEGLMAEDSDRSLNEATTRRSLIDTLVKDVLAWPDDQVRCEEYAEGDYLDYSLGSPYCLAVVEAKRVGHSFDGPAGVYGGWHALSVFRDHSKSNQDAIDQVLRYCQKSGVGLAVLSNGNQILAFLGSRSDGKKPTQGRAVYYSSFADMSARFHELWDMLSFEGVKRGDLGRKLSRNSQLPLPPPLSSRIHSYPGYRIGSEMETDLRILGDLFIQDVMREESITDEFLMDCYCSNGALSQYAVVSKEILRTRYRAFDLQAKTEPARSRKGTNRNLTNDVIAGAITKRPVILLGDVGVGKSMFLKHLFRIESKDLLDKTTVFYVDFLKHSGLRDDVLDQLVKVVTDTLRVDQGIDINEGTFVRSVYNRELNGFKRGIYGELKESDPSSYRSREIEMLATHISESYEHVRRSLVYLQSSRTMSFVIALDNMDQHETSFQEQIFILGQSIAETWPTAVFMSLRPDTFHESRSTGALAAYQPRVFTISPPRSDQVLLRRLEFAKKELLRFGRLPGFPAGLTIDSSSLVVYIDVLLDAFRSNEQLVELIDNLSSGNTRKALDFVSTFVGSGYVQTSRILEAHKAGRSYVVPIHEFIRAILYGDHRYYDPSTSPVPNLFALSTGTGSEHFLLPMLLALVQVEGETESGGFTDLVGCVGRLRGLGFTPDQIDYQFQRAVRHGLLESTDMGDAGHLVRITTAGGYLHKKLVCTFAYIDAVVVDTPVLDPTARGGIRDVKDIGDRADRAEVFLDYLNACWPFGNDFTPFSWPVVLDDSRRSLRDVRRGAARAAERRTRG